MNSHSNQSPNASDRLIIPFSAEYEEYLRDESRRTGVAESISFPTSESEVIESIRQARARGCAVTTQGARTGVVAGAVPQGGHILNLSLMKAVGELQDRTLSVQPGAILSDVQERAHREDLFLPPDPTETSASIGGMVAANASGAMTYLYGPTRHWVESLRVVLSDGDTLRLQRGQCFADGRSFSLTTESGRVISGQLPSYNQPASKSAAGYYVVDNMDLIDLFIGMEGTLGVVTEIGLRLIPRPAAIHGLTVFLPSEHAAIDLVRILREPSPLHHEHTLHNERNPHNGHNPHNEPALRPEHHQTSQPEHYPTLHTEHYPTLHTEHHPTLHTEHHPTLHTEHHPTLHTEHHPTLHTEHHPILHPEPVEGCPHLAAIEFFDADSLALLRKMKSENPAFEKIPPLKPRFRTAIYVEFHADSDDDAEEAVMRVVESVAGLCEDSGGWSDDDSWYATTEREREPLKAFRHAIPEAVNLLIDQRRREQPDLTKLGTDMSVPDQHLESTLAMYRKDIQNNGLESVIFGHIGNNHLHVNILPNSPEDYELGRSLYLSWARRVVDLGGSVSGEHGIGKLKVPFLELMYGPDAINEMRELKRLFDPHMVLNLGNLFPAP